jgi:hypothetical protein
VVYAAGVNILGGSVRTVRESADGWIVASKEIGLDVNVGKTECRLYREISMQDKVTV